MATLKVTISGPNSDGRTSYEIRKERGAVIKGTSIEDDQDLWMVRNEAIGEAEAIAEADDSITRVTVNNTPIAEYKRAHLED